MRRRARLCESAGWNAGERAGKRCRYRTHRGPRVLDADLAGDPGRVSAFRARAAAMATGQDRPHLRRCGLPAELADAGLAGKSGFERAARRQRQLVRRRGILRGGTGAPADLDRMGICRRGRRDAAGCAKRPGMARTHPGLVRASDKRRSPGRRRRAEPLRRARRARTGVGMGRRLQCVARQRRQPLRKRPGQAQVLRRRRHQPAGQAELCGVDANRAALLPQRFGQHQQPGFRCVRPTIQDLP